MKRGNGETEKRERDKRGNGERGMREWLNRAIEKREIAMRR
jgi:hypothetical protein